MMENENRSRSLMTEVFLFHFEKTEKSVWRIPTTLLIGLI